MIENTEPVVLYYYTVKGEKTFTPSLLLASARAEFFGTGVYEEVFS